MAKKQDWIIGGLIFLCLGIFVVFVLLFFFGMAIQDDMIIHTSGEKIAVIDLEGVIYNSKSVVKQLDDHLKNKSIKAMILRVDSPGGGVAASQEIYEAVKRVRNSHKPIVVSMALIDLFFK